jgi:hypothetical protein
LLRNIHAIRAGFWKRFEADWEICSGVCYTHKFLTS